eukprot:COSAG02_NODE_1564_length_11912_cov_7.524676_5_plen_130_part_00
MCTYGSEVDIWQYTNSLLLVLRARRLAGILTLVCWACLSGVGGGAGTPTAVKESVVDDVARLSSAMLKPRPGLSEGSVKSLWLAEVRRVFPACFPYLLFRSSADRHNRQELCAGAAEELQIGAADRSCR